MTLAAVVSRARVQERNVEADLFLSVASDAETHMAMLLSVSVELGHADLAAISESVWGGDEDWGSALRQLQRWPFVSRSTSGLRIVGPIGAALAIQLQEAHPPVFLRAHEILAALEEEQEVGANPEEQWFARGRIAYYLAGIDERRSAAAFRDTFADAPVFSRPLARMWLAGLAIHQEYLLGSESRTVEFFRGFRQYVSGHRQEAERSFALVFEDGVEDVYSAIAMHLWAVIVGTRPGTRGRRILGNAIELSDQIGLVDNAVMARHTLTWSVVSEGQQADEREAGKEILRRALAIARSNKQSADATNDSTLIAWTHRAGAAVEWIVARALGTGGADPALVERLLSELDEVRRDSMVTHELETAAFAANDAAGILRDEERFDEALDMIVEMLRAGEESGSIPLNAVRKLGKTAGSMFRLTSDQEILMRVEETLSTVNRLMG